MRKLIGTLLSAAILAGLPLEAQDAATPARTEPVTLTGILHSGEAGEVKYEVVKPASWNGTLVLDLDFTTSWPPAQRQWFLDRGYAIGGTHRNQNESAYNIREIVENQIALRRLLSDRAGAPKRTIAFG